MSDWIDQEVQRLGGGQRAHEKQEARREAVTGRASDAWDGLLSKVQADVREINEKLGDRVGGELRFVEPGTGAFEVKRQTRNPISLRVTHVEDFVIIKYAKSGGGDGARTEEFRRLEIDLGEDGAPCLKAMDGQIFCLDDASKHLLQPLLSKRG
jgi:hypothetical protein